ncbi:MAG: amidohydrolase family protein, partial [bacterium]|nr:amidohydrolase family protein [bacterium]
KAGKRTATHAQGVAGIKAAVRAGIHSVEHGIFLDDEACEMMVNKGVYLVPTLAAPYWIVEKGTDFGIPQEAVEKSKRCLEYHTNSFRLAMKYQVKIAMGTDAGTPFNKHGDNAFELELMVRAGMSAGDAISSATIQAARLLGIGQETGELSAGKAADIIMVKGNPLDDISLLRTDVVKVFKRGMLVG